MKVLHWAKFYPPDWGGTEGVTYDLATGGARAGMPTQVVAFSRDGLGDEETEAVSVLRARARFHVDTQPLSLKWARLALSAARSAEVIHIHAPNLLAAALLPFVSRAKKIVIHWHTDLVDKGLLGALARPLELYMARRADRLVATSQAYAEASPVLRRFPGKTVVIPLGIADAAESEAAAGIPAEVTRFLRGRPLVLAVGRMVPYKGFDHLIRAAAGLRSDAAVVIVGSGPLEAEHRALIEALGAGDRVMMAGRLSAPDLGALFRAAALYALSSVKRSEAFGIVLLEAMAYGLPIVATRIPGSGVAWAAGEGETGPIVPPRDAASLADAIDSLILDEAERRRFGIAARDRYERMFTRERMLSSVLDLYRELAGPDQ